MDSNKVSQGSNWIPLSNESWHWNPWTCSSQINIAEDPRRLIRDGVVLLQLYRVLQTWNLQNTSHKARIVRVDYRKHQSVVICWLASHPSHFMSSRSSTSYPKPQIYKEWRQCWDSVDEFEVPPWSIYNCLFNNDSKKSIAWPHSTLVSIHV